MPETAQKENKVTFGLKNAHFAVISTDAEGKITFASPVRMPGSVELSLEPRGDMIEFYADDMLYYKAPNNQGYDGTITMADILQQFAIECLGEVLDETDKVMTENTGAKPKDFALMFEFDGDVKATRHVLYSCSASRPTVGSSTKTDSAEPNTNELTFIAGPTEDGDVKTKTTTSTPAEIYDNWYKKVYQKTPTEAPES